MAARQPKLNRPLPRLFLTALLSCSAAAWAEAGNEAVFEVQITGYSRGRGGSSTLATQFYAEQPLPGSDVAAFLVFHHDRDFDGTYVGLARKYGDLQLGLGLGNASYDGIRHPTVNPWLYYASDDAETFLTAEHYSNDLHNDQLFYKGYASLRVIKTFFCGVHGEKGVGVGPMVSWRGDGARIWVTVPMISRPPGGVRGLLGIQFMF